MKYMGSKRAMLTNGLGVLISEVVAGRGRFVDLFSGSGAVVKFVANRHNIPVLASDLQNYAAVLAGAVIHRTAPVFAEPVWDAWCERANVFLMNEPDLAEFAASVATEYADEAKFDTYVSMVDTVRDACRFLPEQFPLARAYGGYYFGLLQALWIDALRATVPDGALAEMAIASLVEAASECSASPGHTAQPFAATQSGLPHLMGSWARDLPARTRRSFNAISQQHAVVKGIACVSDAVQQTIKLDSEDLVFIDPPYSEVQYSRFYHVLEGVAVGRVGSVSGVGRYPDIKERPQSNFSRTAPALEEFDRLMIGVAASGAHALVTFPEANASNGLSGQIVEEISGQYFCVARRAVKSTFSTLGGTGFNRSARLGTTELILHLIPK
jgi:adenine-specific DNA-methyltransferase